MPENRSTKSVYASRHGGGWLAPAQLLAEILCERMAARQGTALPFKFWNSTIWKRPFAHQLKLANNLLKVFSPQAISRALRSPEGKKAYSLGAPFLREICVRAQRTIDREQAQPDISPTPSSFPTNTLPRPPFVRRPSLLALLENV